MTGSLKWYWDDATTKLWVDLIEKVSTIRTPGAFAPKLVLKINFRTISIPHELTKLADTMGEKYMIYKERRQRKQLESAHERSTRRFVKILQVRDRSS